MNGLQVLLLSICCLHCEVRKNLLSECHKPTLVRGITVFLSVQLTFYGKENNLNSFS